MRRSDRRCSTASAHKSFHHGTRILAEGITLFLEGGRPEEKRDEIDSSRNEYRESYAPRGLEEKEKLEARLDKLRVDSSKFNVEGS